MNGIAERLRVLNPAQSRKALVMVATLVGAGLAKIGFDVPNELVYSAVALAAFLILGISIEDGGAKAKPDSAQPSSLLEYKPPGNNGTN